MESWWEGTDGRDSGCIPRVGTKVYPDVGIPSLGG